MVLVVQSVIGDQGETEDQRLTRNVNELLGELRIAQASVQILFGFLLAVVFTSQFRQSSGFEQSLHMAAVLLAVVASALLTAPAAWHRVLFRAGRRYEILRLGNRVVLVGLVCLALAMTATVSLLAKVVFGWIAMTAIGVLSGGLFAALWFVGPLRLR